MKSYVETNHKLPSSVTISGTQVNMRQFLKLSGEAILNIAGTLKTSFTIGKLCSCTFSVRNYDHRDY